MRITASSTNYDFPSYKVKLNYDPIAYRVRVRTISKKGKFKNITTQYRVKLTFYDLTASEKDDLITIFNDDYGDITNITNIDEVESGEAYYGFNTNIYLASPDELLVFPRTTEKKMIENFKTELIFECDTRSTGVKP